MDIHDFLTRECPFFFYLSFVLYIFLRIPLMDSFFSFVQSFWKILEYRGLYITEDWRFFFSNQEGTCVYSRKGGLLRP
jgi:hypothetical protein